MKFAACTGDAAQSLLSKLWAGGMFEEEFEINGQISVLYWFVNVYLLTLFNLDSYFTVARRYHVTTFFHHGKPANTHRSLPFRMHIA